MTIEIAILAVVAWILYWCYAADLYYTLYYKPYKYYGDKRFIVKYYRKVTGTNQLSLLNEPLILAQNEYGQLTTFDLDPFGKKNPELKDRNIMIFIGGNPKTDYSKGGLKKYKKFGVDNYPFNPCNDMVIIWEFFGEQDHGLKDIAAGLVTAVKSIPELSEKNVFVWGVSKGAVVARLASNMDEHFYQRVNYNILLGGTNHGSPMAHPAVLWNALSNKFGGSLLYFVYSSIFTGSR